MMGSLFGIFRNSGVFSRSAVAGAVLLGATLLNTMLPAPAQAVQQDLSLYQLERAECDYQAFLGFDNAAIEGRCNGDFYFPSSAAFRCNLYSDAGYPSELMEKVCALFQGGSFSELMQGASSIE